MAGNNHHIMNRSEIEELRQKTRKTIEEIYLDAWNKGVSPYYQDERCGKDQWIQANPDGSEDLICFDGKIELLKKNIALPGKGRFAFLLQEKNSLFGQGCTLSAIS